MKAQSRRKTHHSVRDFTTNFNQSSVFGERMIGGRVQSTLDSLQLPFPNETTEIIAGDGETLQVGRPNDWLLIGESP